MQRFLIAATAALAVGGFAFTPSASAHEGEPVVGALVGGGIGAVVAGPPGAVVGAIIGTIVGAESHKQVHARTEATRAHIAPERVRVYHEVPVRHAAPTRVAYGGNGNGDAVDVIPAGMRKVCYYEPVKKVATGQAKPKAKKKARC